MKDWIIKKMLSSKKFWYTIAGIIIPIIATKMGVDEQTVTNIVYSIIALVIGQGVADLGKEKK